MPEQIRRAQDEEDDDFAHDDDEFEDEDDYDEDDEDEEGETDEGSWQVATGRRSLDFSTENSL